MKVNWISLHKYEDIKYEKGEKETLGIVKITINRPEVRNAFRPKTIIELKDAFEKAREDSECGVIIFTGEGEKAFSAGNDLKYQAQTGKFGGDMPASGFAGLTNRFDLNKPLIAAVNGVSMGGGFEIALACDLIIASENARMALPEPKVGLAALAAGVHRGILGLTRCSLQHTIQINLASPIVILDKGSVGPLVFRIGTTRHGVRIA